MTLTIVFLTLGVLILSLLIKRRELAELRRAVQSLALQAQSTEGGRVRKLGTPSCSSDSVIEVLRCRLANLSWKLQNLTERQPEQCARELFRSVQSEFKNFEPTQFVIEVEQAALSLLYDGTSCAAAAFVQNDSEEQVCIQSIGARGRRFESCLRYLLNSEEVFTEGLVGAEGRIEGVNEIGALTQFGVHQWFCLKRATLSPGEPLFWYGFLGESSQQLCELEVGWIEKFVREVLSLLKQHLQVRVLKGEVDRENQASEQKSKFLAHFSHDIRSPLNNIRLILREVLERERLSSDSHDLLSGAVENCNSLEELVDSILEYSRHASGALSANPCYATLGGLLSEVVNSFDYVARAKGIDLQYVSELGEEDIDVVMIDPRQIRRVLNNVVGNAIKYTPRGRVIAAVSLLGSSQVLIHVTDTGVGMSQHAVRSLFVPFSRFGTPSEDGIGLGMPLSKALIELNGGEINVSSEEGQGTIFELVFNRANLVNKDVTAPQNTALNLLSQEEMSAQNSPLEPPQAVSLEKHTILIADDDIDHVQALGRVLRARGYQVLEAFGVSDGIALCNFQMPNIVITDNSMPEGGGERLIKFLASCAVRPSILVLSGDDDKRHKAHLHSLGVAETWLKPVDVENLCQWIEVATERQECAA